MKRGLLVGLATAVCTAAFSYSPVYLKDWGALDGDKVTISDFNGQYSQPGGINLFYDGWSGAQWRNYYYVGVYQMKVNSSWTNLLCVEINADAYKDTYRTKIVDGYVGYLANQIKVVTAMAPGQNRLNHSVALALATWELEYDSALYANGIDTYPNLTDNGLGTGHFQCDTQNSAIKGFVADYIHNAIQHGPQDYRMFHSPSDSVERYGSQDYITGVPAPAAMIPFLIGLAASLRRRKKA